MPLGFGRSILSKPIAEAAAATRTPLDIGFVTLSGGAETEISTAESKFGSSSLYVSATGSADDSGLTAGGATTAIDLSGDFTIEWFMKYDHPNNASFNLHHLYNSAVIGDSDGANHIQVVASDDAGGTQADLQLYIGNASIDHTEVDFVASPLDWQHFAISRTGSTVEVYLDGTRIYTKTSTVDFTLDYDFNLFHRNTFNDPKFMASAYFDELRISTTGRYTGTSITVPTSAFTNDADTGLLLHFEGSNGDRSTTDDGG
jgi:hypothetical protein